MIEILSQDIISSIEHSGNLLPTHFFTVWVLNFSPSNSKPSMEPTLLSGDLLLVNRNKGRKKCDGSYLINFDEGLMVKRLEWMMDGTVVIRGDNTSVSREQKLTVIEKEKLHLLGRVVWCG